MKTRRRETLLCSILVSCITFLTTLFIIKKMSRSLRYRKLINKNTKVLNIYTADYIENNIFTNIKDRKNGFESFVYTDRAKEICNIDVFNDKISDENIEAVEETLQVKSFIEELSKISINSTAVIHVYSEKVANEYVKYFKQYKEKSLCKIKVLKLNAVSSDNFVEE